MGSPAKVVAIVAAIAMSYFVGYKVGDGNKLEEQYVLFANLQGEQIISVNNALKSSTFRPIESVKYEYNKSILSDLGCAPWIENLEHLPKERLHEFRRGVSSALSDPLLTAADLSSGCIRNLGRLEAVR